MDSHKTPNKYNLCDRKKAILNIKLKCCKTPDYIKTNYTKRNKYNDIRPADPLISRKIIKYILRYFHAYLNLKLQEKISVRDWQKIFAANMMRRKMMIILKRTYGLLLW